MATRATVIIKSGNRKTYLYHHYDGYPTGIGAAIKSLLQQVDGKTNPEALQRKMLKGWGDKDNSMSHKYSKIGGVTGDSEYVYTIDTDRGTLSYKDIDIETGKFGRFGRSVNMFTATKGLTKQASGTGNSNG